MPGGMLAGLIEGEANRPRHKWPRGVVLAKLFPERQGRLLEDIPGILRVGQNRADVSMDVPFRLQKEPEELAAVVGWGRAKLLEAKKLAVTLFPIYPPLAIIEKWVIRRRTHSRATVEWSGSAHAANASRIRMR